MQIQLLHNNGNTVSNYCLGFCFAAIFVPIPIFSDIVPFYGALLQRLIRPLFILLILIGSISRRKRYVNIYLRLILLLSLFCALLCLSTILSENSILSAVAFSVSIIGVPLFFLSVGSRMSYNILKGISDYLVLITTINVISIIIFHNNGLYNIEAGKNYYILGHVNSAVKIELPAIALLTALDYFRLGKISRSTWFATLFVLFSLYYSKSYVGAVGFSVYLLFIIAITINKRFIRYVPYWLPMVISLIIFFVCCIMSAPAVQLALAGIENYFGRPGALNSRTMMWAQGINIISNNLMGCGRIVDYSNYIRLGNYYPSSAHNLYIDITMQVGLAGVALLIYILFYAQKCTPKWSELPVIPASLISYAIMFNFEPYFSEPFFIALLILLFAFISMNFVGSKNFNTHT